MSAYGHQMEENYSARSLSGGSELRSSYVLESRFYITFFAVTNLITSLATIGLLMITMLVVLTFCY
ncbi:hypothetical protein HN51_045685 [Arachis hypogaea]